MVADAQGAGVDRRLHNGHHARAARGQFQVVGALHRQQAPAGQGGGGAETVERDKQLQAFAERAQREIAREIRVLEKQLNLIAELTKGGV